MEYVTTPQRLGETELPDGRLMGWAEWGPEDGIPVLLVPGAATSRLLGVGAGVPERVGVRIVAVDRPGLGASTPLPGRTFADFADDVRQLMQRRGLGRPPVIGSSQGAPFVLACAAAGITGPVAIVSGADEVALPAFAEALPPHLRSLVDMVATDPDAAEAGFAGLDADAMLKLVHDASPASDLGVYTSPDFHAAYRAAMDDAFRQGPAGYARDTVLAMGRWPFDLAAIRVPVQLWYGEEDTSHSPDHGATLASRIPTATRRLVPGIGGAVLWTHTEPILSELLMVV
ncbi:alpha/beta fold hydrolase [Pseudonocardia sp. TRM90224]|uniref:alpha/beta fold hydrolase n=1 Tax=Pseudonocardia sp. TRM90224 TaxID=2812678 RepID=UPI001E3C19D5|nr:alpha/beta hydrolase [Pseudonocardia sp. TRM90224]